MKTLKLNNDLAIPAIGFGTFKVKPGAECVDAVVEALNVGYRHIDTAAIYENEASVGEGVRKSGLKREEVFVTTKLWNSERGYEKAMQAFEDSLARLQMNYVDLYLVHWPANTSQYDAAEAKALNAETWKAMEAIYKSGKAKAIGVSNFLAHHLEDLMETAEILPMVNQIEFHPGHLQQETVDLCKKHTILVQAWSPLGQGAVLDHPLLLELSQKYQVDTAAVCLQFALQLGICVLPKSITPARILSNLQVDFILEEADIQRIKGMGSVGFTGLNPDTVGF